jgi:hypothetical protein
MECDGQSTKYLMPYIIPMDNGGSEIPLKKLAKPRHILEKKRFVETEFMSKLGKPFLGGLCQFVTGDQHQDGVTRQQAHYKKDDKAED